MSSICLKDTGIVSKKGKKLRKGPCHVINYSPVILMTKEMQGAVTMGTFILFFSGNGAPVSHCTLSSAASCLPDFFFPMTANVIARMQPIYHPFFLKGTLTAVNDCNKTKQQIPHPKSLYSASLKMGSIETEKKVQKIALERQMFLYHLTWFIPAVHVIYIYKYSDRKSD